MEFYTNEMCALQVVIFTVIPVTKKCLCIDYTISIKILAAGRITNQRVKTHLLPHYELRWSDDPYPTPRPPHIYVVLHLVPLHTLFRQIQCTGLLWVSGVTHTHLPALMSYTSNLWSDPASSSTPDFIKNPPQTSIKISIM